MVKFKYTDLIKAIENEKTIKLVGKIDVDILSEYKIENLYYVFPLIERMILELFKLFPNSDVEHYEQGTMKTMISLLEKNDHLEIIPLDVKELIKRYYADECPRNTLFHIKEEEPKLIISFEELNYLIMILLSLLKKRMNITDALTFEPIEKL